MRCSCSGQNQETSLRQQGPAAFDVLLLEMEIQPRATLNKNNLHRQHLQVDKGGLQRVHICLTCQRESGLSNCTPATHPINELESEPKNNCLQQFPLAHIGD